MPRGPAASKAAADPTTTTTTTAASASSPWAAATASASFGKQPKKHEATPEQSVSRFFSPPASAPAVGSKRTAAAAASLSEPPKKKEAWSAVIDPRLVDRAPRFYERAYHRNYFSSTWDFRPPGSGDFCLDLLRRAPHHALIPVAAPSLANVYKASAHLLAVFTQAERDLVALAVAPEIVRIVSVLYYKYGTLWVRADALAVDLEQQHVDQSLLDVAEKCGLLRLSTTRSALNDGEDAAECASLLTADELKTMLNRKREVRKPELVQACVGALPFVLNKMHVVVGGTFVQIAPSLALLLLRMHQFVLAAADYAPEEFASLLLTGALAGKAALIEPHQPALACDRGCHEVLFSSLDGLDKLSHGIPRGLDCNVYAAMHEASSRLLDCPRACACWMSSRASDNDAQLLLNGVYLLEKERKYAEAVHYLELASSKITNAHLRGKALVRWSVDMGHLDRPDAALAKLEDVVMDARNGFVFPADASGLAARTRNRMGGVGAELIGRIEKLSVPPRRWKQKLPGLRALNTTLIKVHRPDPSRRVEHLALDYFKQVKGWPKGLHCENGIMLTLFGLLFVDVSAARPTFCDRPRRSTFVPADDDGDSQRILRAVRDGTAPLLVAAACARHQDKLIYGVNLLPERTTGAELAEIAGCIPAEALVMVFALLLDNFEAWQGGLPDLLLWNPAARTAAFVEIKGPGDSLSDRQRAWGEKLSSVAGVHFEVCHVEYIAHVA